MKFFTKKLVVVSLMLVVVSSFSLAIYLTDIEADLDERGGSTVFEPSAVPQFLLEKIGQYDGNSSDVFVDGDLAYLANGDDGVKIINISDPTNPVEIGQFYDGGEANGIFVSGDFAYVADGTDNLEILNISDPTTPFEAGSDYTGSYGIFVEGTHGFSTSLDGNGFEWFDLSDPTDPELHRHGFPSRDSRGIHAVAGSYAYCADSAYGVVIYDVSDPTHTSISVDATIYDGSGFAFDVFVENEYAYIADGPDGLEIIDISNSHSPFEVGQYSDGSNAQGVFITNSYAYVACGSDGLRLIDVRDPTSPIKVGQYNNFSNINNTFVVDEYVFVADYNKGLEILQVGFDTDGDGLTDYKEENIYLTNPYESDTDFDFLSDYQEINVYSTNPLDSDDDDDFLKDGEEILGYYAPTNPGANASGYVFTAYNDSDSDDDSYIDSVELYQNTDPNDANSHPDPVTITLPPVTVTPPPETVTLPPETITLTPTEVTGVALIFILLGVSISSISLIIIKRRKT